MKIPKVAVTGLSGMIGKHLKQIFNLNDITYFDLNRSIWDLSKWMSHNDFDRLLSSINTIFHFGAVLPNYHGGTKNLFNINVRSCLNIADWAYKNNKKVIYISSSTVYSNPDKKNIMEKDKKVISGLGGFYANTKLLAENIFNYFKSKGLHVSILRPSSVYGIGMNENSMISTFIKEASKGKTLEVYDYNNKINFINAYDVANAAFLCYRKKINGTFNIGSESLISLLEIANLITQNVGKGDVKGLSISEKPLTRFDLNCSKAHDKINFCPLINLSKGIMSMINKDFQVLTSKL